MLIVPVAVIMLISCASRTSISGSAGFWMVYYLLGNYRKMKWTTKAMVITIIVFVCIILAVIVDWTKVWSDFVGYSGRAENYTSTFPIITAKGVWLTGLGMSFVENLNRLRTMGALDSFYLYTILGAGLIGFFILIGTILCFSFMYFQDTKYMTKFHRLAGGLLAVIVYYGLFESKLFGKDIYDLLNWILLVLAINERYAIIASERQHHHEAKYKPVLKPQSISPSVEYP